MFGVGMMDNVSWCFINIALGFEFESKIVPFGAKLFVEMVAVFLVASSLSLWSLESKSQFRMYFLAAAILGVFSVLLLFKYKFKEIVKK